MRQNVASAQLPDRAQSAIAIPLINWGADLTPQDAGLLTSIRGAILSPASFASPSSCHPSR